MLMPADIDLDDTLATYAKQGFVMLPAVLAADDVARLRVALAPHLQGKYPGRNDFEGFHSERVYALVAKHAVFGELAAHPLVLTLLDRLLHPGYLLSAFLAIDLHPGETVQDWHFDDGFVRQPRPRPSNCVSCFWAIDEFTATNGATELLPGSHVGAALEREPGANETVQALMPAGSLLVMSGLLYHRGGANRSAADRLMISPQYCEPWARQQENHMLSLSKVQTLALPERVRELIGYQIHPPFMGHVDGRHPLKTLQ